MDPKSSEIAARALEFGDVMVAEVMVRRDRIAAILRGATPEEVQLEERHRMPIFERELDRVVGYIGARDVLAVAWEQHLFALDDIMRPLIYVPLSARIGAVLREMQAKQIEIAIVGDEHGGTGPRDDRRSRRGAGSAISSARTIFPNGRCVWSPTAARSCRDGFLLQRSTACFTPRCRSHARA